MGLPFRGIRFCGHGAATEAQFPNGPGLAIRRIVLHQLLVEAAEAAGVQLCWKSRSLPEVRGEWLIGADGQNSQVRRKFGLQMAVSERHQYGYRQHYQVAPWTDFVEVYWHASCQVYVAPIGSTEVGIAVISASPHLRVNECVSCFPDLANKMSGVATLSAERGALSVSRTLRHVHRDKVALVGDASGSVGAITGEGIGLAFHQALFLADAVAANDLSEYERRHRKLFRKPRIMERLLMLMADRALIQRSTLKLFERWPAPFAFLLATHAA